MGRTRDSSSRRGRKLRKPKAVEAEEQVEVANMAMEVTAPREARKSKRSENGRRRGSKRRGETAFMAEGDAADDNAAAADGDAPADDKAAAADAGGDAGEDAAPEAPKAEPVSSEEQKKIDDAVENGNFKSDFINADDEDQEEIAAKVFKKTAVDARGKIHEWCNDIEELANLMLRDALQNKSARETTLQARMTLLTRLWQFRDTSDCEDDYNMEEWQAAMRGLATIQRKLRSLDGKISALMLGGEMSSSDTDGEGEKTNMANLKRARQNLRYALGEGTVAA